MRWRVRLIGTLLDAAGQGTIPCLFRTLTGLYCLGCGGTRALRAWMQGKLWLSFCYHPLVPYTAFWLPVLLVFFLFCRKKKKTYSKRLSEYVLLGGVLLLVGNVLIKNGFLLLGKRDLLALLDELVRQQADRG